MTRPKPYGVQMIFNPGVEGATKYFATFEEAVAYGLDRVRERVLVGRGDLVLLFNDDNVDIDWQDGLTEEERDTWYDEFTQVVIKTRGAA